MLVLSRHVGERIVIDDRVEVEVISIQGNRVRLGIVADREIPVRRSEIERIERVERPHREDQAA